MAKVQDPSRTHQEFVGNLFAILRAHVKEHGLIVEAFQIRQAFELSEGGYRLSASLGAEEVYAPALFPALTIPLGELWG